MVRHWMRHCGYTMFCDIGWKNDGTVMLDALRRCQPDTLTPIEAMSLIYEWKQKLN